MDTFTLVITAVSLLFALIFLVFVYVWMTRTKKSVVNDAKAPETFESLSAIIHSGTSTNQALNYAADTILKRFGTIGDYPHYEVLIKGICTHANTDSKLVSRFEKSLRDANPKFKEKIQKTLKEGLAKRDKK
jgi:Na+-transporting methylmalonyl-CoA/oxaloacetate decarboxylase gamma subunit